MIYDIEKIQSSDDYLRIMELYEYDIEVAEEKKVEIDYRRSDSMSSFAVLTILWLGLFVIKYIPFNVVATLVYFSLMYRTMLNFNPEKYPETYIKRRIINWTIAIYKRGTVSLFTDTCRRSFGFIGKVLKKSIATGKGIAINSRRKSHE